MIFDIVSFGFAKIIFCVSLRNLIVILNDWSSPSIDVEDEVDSGELIFDSGDIGFCSGKNSFISLDLKMRNLNLEYYYYYYYYLLIILSIRFMFC